jgi:hypothetical protein
MSFAIERDDASVGVGVLLSNYVLLSQFQSISKDEVIGVP